MVQVDTIMSQQEVMSALWEVRTLSLEVIMISKDLIIGYSHLILREILRVILLWRTGEFKSIKNNLLRLIQNSLSAILIKRKMKSLLMTLLIKSPHHLKQLFAHQSILLSQLQNYENNWVILLVFQLYQLQKNLYLHYFLCLENWIQCKMLKLTNLRKLKIIQIMQEKLVEQKPILEQLISKFLQYKKDLSCQATNYSEQNQHKNNALILNPIQPYAHINNEGGCINKQGKQKSYPTIQHHKKTPYYRQSFISLIGKIMGLIFIICIMIDLYYEVGNQLELKKLEISKCFQDYVDNQCQQPVHAILLECQRLQICSRKTPIEELKITKIIVKEISRLIYIMISEMGYLGMAFLIIILFLLLNRKHQPSYIQQKIDFKYQQLNNAGFKYQ